MQFTLHYNGNRIAPTGSCELDADRILCNDIKLPGEHSFHNTRLWVIGNEYGALGAVWASNEQDALDELVDADLGNGLLVDEDHVESLTDEERDELSHLGNAGEWADLTYCWMAEVSFDKQRDFNLLLKFAEARGACVDHLGKL